MAPAPAAPQPAGPALTGLGFPEALRWRAGAVWFSDMFRARVLRWTPGRPAEVVLDARSGCPTMPGGLGWLPDGDLLVVACLGRRVLRVPAPGHPGRSAPTVHADLTGLLDHPANDMHVGDDGTAWVGGYGFDPEREPPRPSRLVRIEPDGTMGLWGDDLVFPNGCEVDAAGRLVVAETFADRVSTLDAAGRRVTLAELPAGSGPDGLSVAPDGSVLVALAFAGTVVRLDGGGWRTVHHARPVQAGPGSGPTGCYDVAAAPDGRWLAVATASQDEALAARVDTGALHLVPTASWSPARH